MIAVLLALIISQAVYAYGYSESVCRFHDDDPRCRTRESDAMLERIEARRMKIRNICGKDISACRGGFVTDLVNRKIYRITDLESGPYSVKSTLVDLVNIGDEIRITTPNAMGWYATTLRHAQQFVPREK